MQKIDYKKEQLTIKELNEIYHDERIVPIGIEGKSKSSSG